MKKLIILLTIILLILFSINANAKMLVLEHGLFDATPGTLRLNILDVYAGYDMWTWEEYPDDKYEYARAIQNMGVTYTLSPALEVSAGMQYMYWLQRFNNVETSHLAGFSQANADIKYCLGGFLTIGARYYYQYAAPERELGGGNDIKGYAVLDSKAMSMSVGYVLTGAYDAGGTNYDPGEVITGGFGLKLGGEKMKFLFEIRLTSFETNKIDTIEIPDTGGMTLDVFPGMMMELGSVRIKLGVGVAVGGTDIFGINGLTFETENLRGPGASPVKYREVSYDIAPVLSISYAFGG